MRAIVTGVAGFIGSHVAEELIREGNTVVGIDCFTPYYSPTLKRRNLASLSSASRFRFLKNDILLVNLGDLVRSVDVVFHLAAQPGVRLSWAKFDQYLRNNLLTTQLLLERCGRYRKCMMFASSSSVYGDSESYPTKEETQPQPVSPYGVTKQAGERLCALYRKSDGLKVITLRYFTVYGPRQRPDMAIHKFIGLALQDKPLPLYGDGNQERDFTFITDIVSGTLAAVENKVWGETLNLGGGRVTKLTELARTIIRETGSQSRIRHEPPQRGDAKRTMADISKAKELIGYRPSVDLETGIRKQIEWQSMAGRRETDTVR